MATVLVWSERPEPNVPGGGLRDCTYSSGLMGLVFGGYTKFPLGVYTVAEREALERSDAQPNETGASLDDLIVAVQKRYAIEWAKSRIALLAQHKARADLGFVIQGLNGNLPAGHTLRRWDPSFTGGHCVFITPTGDGTHVRWYDPLAPNKYGGDQTDWATVYRWIGNMPAFITVRVDDYAPVPPPKVYTQAEMDAAIAKVRAAEAALAETRTKLDAAIARLNAIKAAGGWT